MRAYTLFLTLAMLLCLPGPAATASSATRVADVGWEHHGPIGKIVIRLSGPFTYRAVASSSAIVVDLWPARHTSWRTLRVADPYVRRIRVSQVTRDLARVRIDLRRPARYKTFTKTDPQVLAIQVIPPWLATTRLPASIAYEKHRVPTGTGTTAVHVLRINPLDPRLELRPVLAADMVVGKEPTSVIATHNDAVAGINGGYFAGAGTPLGMVVIDGELISAPLPRRSVFAISRDGRPVIGSFAFAGRLLTGGNVTLWISTVNRPPKAGGLALYTTHYGPLTPPHRLAAVVRNGVVDHLTTGRILIPDDGFVLAVSEGDTGLLTRHLTVGGRVWLTLQVAPDLEVISALGGGPRLVREGREFIPFMWEWFSLALHRVRAPRSAVGITRSGKLLLVTVDGRSAQNTGMTLRELAALLARLGARDAMNLDGGGSATMVVGGRIVNEPSDGQERPVASALLVFRRPGP